MDKAMRAIRRFKELVGDLAVEQITKAHVIEFKDKFLASEQSPGVQQTPVNTDKFVYKDFFTTHRLLSSVVNIRTIDYRDAACLSYDWKTVSTVEDASAK